MLLSRFVFVAGVVLLAAGLLVVAGGCGGDDDSDSSSDQSQQASQQGSGARGPGGRGGMGGRRDVPATPVGVAEVQRGSIPRLLRSSGRLRARQSAQVSAGIGGQILELHVELGDVVQRRDVLATFDVDEFERALAEARLTLDQRRSELHRAQLQLQHARTELARAQDETRPEGYDTALYTIEQFDRLRLSAREAEVTLELARYNQRAAELAVDRSVRDLARCEVRAPFEGVVAARHVEAFDRVGQGDLLFELVNVADLELRIRITEGEATAVRPGQPAILASRGRLPLAYPAEVSRVSPVVDVEQGVVEVVLQVLPWRSVQGLHLWGHMQQLMRLTSGPFPGPLPTVPFLSPGTTPPLRPGMFVGVEIATAVLSNAVLCPKEALQYDGDTPYVFAVRERFGTLVAERTPLQVRPDFATPEAIQVESGLQPGDRVVVRQADLRDGAPIRIMEE